jgi:hypothetical protein
VSDTPRLVDPPLCPGCDQSLTVVGRREWVCENPDDPFFGPAGRQVTHTEDDVTLEPGQAIDAGGAVVTNSGQETVRLTVKRRSTVRVESPPVTAPSLPIAPGGPKKA